MDDCNWLDLVGRLEGEPKPSLAVVQCPPARGGISPPTQGEQPQPQPPNIDWENLQITETLDDEGRLEIMDEEQLYVLLGLRAKDEAADNAREAGEAAFEDASKEARSTDANGAEEEGVDDTPVDDEVPGERMMRQKEDYHTNQCLGGFQGYPYP
ncbi:hypothetical protein E2562_037914 [Oryza meyeriana var. granulata]|uniref:Uncharacterized protein n=1 Tax=Oryza meyeriana var. granulata TaxID=110450 RepID=A0A6G1EU00_9ORYZ|nr:hypothetical protein E2562_037914 [Oryza meyeriana var. granulata]